MTSPRDPTAGVSLVEVLAVLAIVGAAAGVATLGLGALDRGTRGAAEASRLADRLQFAADEVMVTGARLALVPDDRGYRFVQWGADGWAPAVQGDLGTRHGLPGGLRLDGGGDRPILIAPEMPQPPVVLSLTDGENARRVVFDGLSASVVAGD